MRVVKPKFDAFVSAESQPKSMTIQARDGRSIRGTGFNTGPPFRPGPFAVAFSDPEGASCHRMKHGRFRDCEPVLVPREHERHRHSLERVQVSRADLILLIARHWRRTSFERGLDLIRSKR